MTPKLPAVLSWTFFETGLLAADAVKETLARCQNHNLLAVDDGVALYVPPNFGTIDFTETQTVCRSDSINLRDVNEPGELELLTIVNQVGDKRIRGYLKKKAKVAASGLFNVRLALTGIDFPVPPFNPLRLHVAQLSYWTEENFNRAILLSPDSELLAFKEDSLSKIFTWKRNGFDIPCPSQLYAEVSLITSDNKFVVLEKGEGMSTLVKRGFPFTCGIEEGLIWGNHLAGGRLDPQRAVSDGVRLELQIPREEIASLEFFALALEHTHLNTAVLGAMKLSIGSDALIRRIKSSHDFGRGFEFIDVQSAFRTIFVEPQVHAGSWHPTARLRILLTLYRLFGRDTLWNTVESSRRHRSHR